MRLALYGGIGTPRGPYTGKAEQVQTAADGGRHGVRRQPDIRDPQHPYWRNRIEVEDEQHDAIQTEAPARPKRAQPIPAKVATVSLPPGAEIARALLHVPREDRGRDRAAETVRGDEAGALDFEQRERELLETILLLELID